LGILYLVHSDVSGSPDGHCGGDGMLIL